MPLNIDTSIHSPNFSSRNGRRVFMLVVHATAGRRASDIDILTNDKVPLKRRVSVHYYVTKDGHIYQLVPEQYAAWHAGEAYWNKYGPVDIQEGSIGIELENLNNGVDPYPVEQYNSVLALSQDIVARNSISANNIVTHQMIAGATEGKTDPRGFPFEKFKGDILWGKWGDSYPLPPEQRGWGIPTVWANDGGALGEATGPLEYTPKGGPDAGAIASQTFCGGIIIHDQRYNLAPIIFRYRRPVKPR
jgi:N-acetyl-anhydromuramyl-L-alanine amidase AmpD